MSRSWSLAKSKSTIASDKVWKAKSQAAYQGYSHLSGMEMMSAFSMWNHSMFRRAAVANVEQRMAFVLGQPLLQVEVVELLAPQHSSQSLTVHPALVFVQRTGGDALVKFVRLLESLS